MLNWLFTYFGICEVVMLFVEIQPANIWGSLMLDRSPSRPRLSWKSFIIGSLNVHGQSWSSSLLLVSIDSPSHRRPPSWESIITLPPPPQSQCSDTTHLPHHYILSANVKINILPFPKNTSPFPFRNPWVLLNRISPRSYSSPFIRPPSHSSGQSGLIRWSGLKGNMCSFSSPPH